MEAMAAGLPVVAVDATGTSDVLVHEQEGLLTKNDSNALAQGIEQILAQPERRESFREAALKRAKTLSTEAQAKKMEGVYQRAIDDQRGGRTVQVTQPKLAAKRSRRWRTVVEDLIDIPI
jgi:glycosyltransferase involved in cell wall biosynthesis